MRIHINIQLPHSIVHSGFQKKRKLTSKQQFSPFSSGLVSNFLTYTIGCSAQNKNTKLDFLNTVAATLLLNFKASSLVKGFAVQNNRLSSSVGLYLSRVTVVQMLPSQQHDQTAGCCMLQISRLKLSLPEGFGIFFDGAPLLVATSSISQFINNSVHQSLSASLLYRSSAKASSRPAQ